MELAHLASYFFGGVFLANAVPHFVAGTMGHSFQSPFAKPPGVGLSSATVNAVWGCFNFVVAYALVLGALIDQALVFTPLARMPIVYTAAAMPKPMNHA